MLKKALSAYDLCLIGLFTAIIAVLAQISIPLPYVALTLQTFAIPLAGIVLGAKKGTIATLVYVLLGAAGVPVFAGFSGGLDIVLGLRGGFILSFPLMAYTAGIGAAKANKIWLFLWLTIGAVINYLCGTIMFSLMMPCDLSKAVTFCVIPFIPTAIIKIILAGGVGIKLKNSILKMGIAI